MALKTYDDLEQGTDEWFAARCGVLTASTIGSLLTPTCSGIADNKAAQRLVNEIASQRVNGICDPHVQAYAFQRGHEDEMEAKILYAQKIAPVTEVGFMTDDRWGFKLGYSPDGLVGDDGLIECKSRLSAFQMDTICSQAIPIEYMAQIQTGMLVSGRKWLDFISFPAMGGGKMLVKRVYPDAAMQDLLIRAATDFEQKVWQRIQEYKAAENSPDLRLIDTVRRADPEEIML